MKIQQTAAAGLFLGGLLLAGTGNAGSIVDSLGIYVYPAKGQTAEAQSQDDYQCFDWAKQQSNYDPMNPPEVVAQAPEQGPSGARVKGALRGAAGGAIIGEVANDDAGDGAAIGATLGVLRGGAHERQSRREQTAQAEQAAQQQGADLEKQFKNAYSVCMEGRGYSVKF